MNPRHCIVSLALLPLAAFADTSIYSTNFSTGALKGTLGDTVNVGDWVIASTKNTTSTTGSGSASYAASAFSFGMAGTTSGVIEAQNRFTSTPVTLTNVNDFIKLTVLFTDANNLIKDNGGGQVLNSTINIGLFDSGSVSPAAGLAAAGLTATTGNTNFGTGFAQNWEGYAARIGSSASTSSSIKQIMTRPKQTANTASANQDLLFMGVGGGTYGQNVTVGVPGLSVVSGASTLAGNALVNATQYQLVYTVTLSAADQYTIEYQLNSADGLTNLQTISGTTTPSNFITGLSFDGLAVGYRSAQATGTASNLATGISLNSVNVSINSASPVPEPSTYAALVGMAGLAFAASRRRRN